MAPLLIFIVLDPGNLDLMINNIAPLNPLLYYCIYTTVANCDRPRILESASRVILLSALAMLATVLLGYISPGALDVVRNLFVSDLGNRRTSELLNYSGSPGLFSEPSYQALISASILGASLASPVCAISVLIATVSVVTILLTKSVLGFGVTLILLACRLLFSVWKRLMRLAYLQRLPSVQYLIIIVSGIFSSAIVILITSASYSRIDRLIQLTSSISPTKLIESLTVIEEAFGSNRLFVQAASCDQSLIAQAFSDEANNHSGLTLCANGFSLFQQLWFTVGAAGGTLIAFSTVACLYMHSTSCTSHLSSRKLSTLRPMAVFYTLFGVVFLGPVASPLLYIPLLMPFNDVPRANAIYKAGD